MLKRNTIVNIAAIAIVLVPFVAGPPAFAAGSGDVAQVQEFIKSIIKIIASLAGLVATGFFVVGGFSYITSSGNPEHLDRAKRTITWAAVGLAITIAAFVISNIVTDLATGAFGN